MTLRPDAEAGPVVFACECPQSVVHVAIEGPQWTQDRALTFKESGRKLVVLLEGDYKIIVRVAGVSGSNYALEIESGGKMDPISGTLPADGRDVALRQLDVSFGYDIPAAPALRPAKPTKTPRPKKKDRAGTPSAPARPKKKGPPPAALGVPAPHQLPSLRPGSSAPKGLAALGSSILSAAADSPRPRGGFYGGGAVLPDPHAELRERIRKTVKEGEGTYAGPADRSDIEQDPEYTVQRVFFATDREPADVAPFFGDVRSTKLNYGSCEVSIPRHKKSGTMPRPNWLEREDPKKHVMALSVTHLEEGPFYWSLHNHVASSTGRQLLVFIHGYNVSFHDAVLRTGQIASDLRFPGAAVTYSWPSHANPILYPQDASQADYTEGHLTYFLKKLAIESGAEIIHIIAHSMGTRALTAALRECVNQISDISKVFREVMLAAPDIDAGKFENVILPAILPAAKRLTLYASSNDNALKLAKLFHGGRRAGDSGDFLILAKGLDTVDASEVDTSVLGHSYYGSKKSVLDDIAVLVKQGLPPSQRETLRGTPEKQPKYWTFRL